MRLIGLRNLATVPVEQLKRVRLVRRADGCYAQFVLQVERRVSHVPTGSVIGIDVGIAAYLTDSDGAVVANPRFISLAEARLKHSQRRLSRRSLHYKHPAVTPPQPPQPVTSPATKRQSANWGKAKQRVGRTYLTLQRQREDFARKQASALISSHDLLALKNLQVRTMVRNLVRNLVRTRRRAKTISDVGWTRLRRWVEYYGRLQEIPVVAIPPQYTTQNRSGVLPDGSPCGVRIRQSLSVRTHVRPRCGLMLDRDHNAAAVILQHGMAVARAEGRWPQERSETSETSETRETRETSRTSGTVGHTGT